MQPRQKSFATVASISLGKLRHAHPHVLKWQRLLTAAPVSIENHNSMVRGHRRTWLKNNICEIAHRQRTMVTAATSTPSESVNDTRNQLQSNVQGHMQHPSPLPDMIQRTPSTSVTNMTKKRTNPPLQQNMVPLSQQVHAIMRDVKIGQLTNSDIQSILSVAFERSKVSSQRATTKKDDIDYAIQLVQRLLQEATYWHSEYVYLQQNHQRNPDAANRFNLGRSLGTIFHYIIIGSSHLPAISKSSNITSGKSNENPAITINEHSYVTTGKLLMSMLQWHHHHPSIYPPPTATLYNAWLYSCYVCSSISDDATYTAEAILRNIEGPIDQGEHSPRIPVTQSSFTILPPPPDIPKPTKGMYNHVILIHANRAGTVYGAAVQAEDWLMRMSKAGVHPSTDTFNRVLKAWADSPEKEGGNRAADLLHLMLKLSDDASTITHGNEIAPDEISFGTVINAFMKRAQPEACQLILEEAVSYFSSKPLRRSRFSTLNQCWNTAFFGWSTSGRADAPERLEKLLNDGITIGDQTYKLKPDKSTYVACIGVHLKSGRPDRIDKAERYLQLMVDSMTSVKHHEASANAPVGNTQDATPTTLEFNSLINAWFRSLDEFENIGINKNAGTHPIGYTSTRASNLLYQMLMLQEKGYTSCIPIAGSFHMCIESLCKTAAACITAAKRIKKVLVKTDDIQSATRNHNLTADYKSAMKRDAMSAMDKAIEILDIAEHRKLSTDSGYAVVLINLCRISDPVYIYKAATILQRYEEKTDEWNLKWQVDKCWMYHTIITALNTIGTIQAAELSLTILRRIPKSGKRAVDSNYIWICTGVLVAFAKHPGSRSVAVAEELFAELISAPNHNPKSNNSINVDFCERVLWILADANTKQSAKAACDVLNTILDLHSANKLSFEPSAKCFNGCIFALAQAHDIQFTIFSVQLLKLIVAKYEEKSTTQLPTKAAFDIVVRSCQQFGSGEMIRHAKDVTELAEKHSDALYGRPITITSVNNLHLD